MSIDVVVPVRIDRPLERVVEYVIDPANEPKWIAGISESRQVTPGEIGKGSRVTRVAKFMGRRIEYTPEVIEYDPRSRLLMRTDKPFDMTIEYRFAAKDGGTEFEQRLSGGPRGIMALADPLMARMVKRNVARDMQRLKRILEAGG